MLHIRICTVLALIDHCLWMFHTKTDCECLRLHKERLVRKHLKCISGRMAECKHRKLRIDLLLPVRSMYDKPGQPSILTHKIRHACPKHEFTAQAQDLLTQIADHSCQNIGTNVGLVVIEDLRRCATFTK